MAKASDSSGDAQGRFVVSLPKELGPELDKIAGRMSAAIAESSGVAFELSRGQVVASLIKTAIKQQATPATEA